MTKVPQNIALKELAQSAVSKYLKQGIAYEKKVLADTDSEDLHQMRVGLRRLRTALQVFKVAIELPKPGREPNVAAVARKLGGLRDLDVVSETLRKGYGPDLPDPEQYLLEQVLSHLYDRRKITFKQVRKLLKGKKYQQMKRSLKAWTQAPTYREIAQLPAAMVVPDLVGPLVSQLWLHPGFLQGARVTRNNISADTHLTPTATVQLISDQGPVLHSLRKQVKRVRYQLKLVSDLYGKALDEDLARLSDMQEILGNLQDSTVLEAFVLKAVPDAKDQMPTLLALLTDCRYRAWKQWQTYQTYYLNSAHRHQLRATLNQPAGTIQVSQPSEKEIARKRKGSSDSTHKGTLINRGPHGPEKF